MKYPYSDKQIGSARSDVSEAMTARGVTPVAPDPAGSLPARPARCQPNCLCEPWCAAAVSDGYWPCSCGHVAFHKAYDRTPSGEGADCE